MKKLIVALTVLIVIILVFIFAKPLFFKEPAGQKIKEQKIIKKPVDPFRAPAFVDLGTGEAALVFTSSMPEGKLSVLNINKNANYAIISIYGGKGTLTPGTEIRKIVGKVAVLELKLCGFAGKKARISVENNFRPEGTSCCEKTFQVKVSF